MACEPTFRPFDANGPLRIYYRNLPHWRQPGATYFVTFRQDDSVPAAVLAEWLDLRRRWLLAHDLPVAPVKDVSCDEEWNTAYRRISVGVRRAFEREQSRMLHEELDRCHGSCLLRHAELRRIVQDACYQFHGTRLWAGDIVIMPNHVHWIVQPFGGWELEDLLGSIKKWTSRHIGQWQVARPALARAVYVEHRRERF